MNIQTILAKYDSMFGHTSLAEIEAYLYENIQEAKRASEEALFLMLIYEKCLGSKLVIVTHSVGHTFI
jgi:hypothetical protein